ncbi:Ig-like domain-containing protein [Actinotalea sp. K2]|uniref:Ig-like domain-containing protein n=1 Tax=Actinotalea sp. K2 TaxID=2939438 RepID=UPI0020180842|nr:Ig-like domain-containing protein [Actinotalea sp. K2]MCL3862849.1 Ig-like domain-containing protein [Actinotalea sp. K2]
MPRSRTETPDARPDDSGLTLIEVIVSLVLLGIVATAALYFFIQGTQTTSHLQRSQNAVAVANEAMERAYAVNPMTAGGSTISGLAVGRRQVDVEAAWSALAALNIDGLDETYPLWDPDTGLTTSDNATVPLVVTRAHSGQQYTVTTLVGVCYRPSNVVSTDQVCSKLPGVPSALAEDATPPGMLRMLRVTTVVTWPSTSGQCAGDQCSYHLSGLVDRSSDLKWNQVLTPIAVDDFEVFLHGESRAINVLTNDLLGPVTSNPVMIVSPPASGQGTATVATNGVITYTAPTSGSGRYTFTYRIKDASGAQSDPATVEITLLPLASNDTALVLGGTSATVNVTANDVGSPALVTITEPPTNGTATVSGLAVVYTPSVASGGDWFEYRYTDTSGQESPVARVNILINTIVSGDKVLEVPAKPTSTPTWTDLTPKLLEGNADPTGLRVTVTSGAAAGGTLQVDGVTFTGAPLTGTTVRYDSPQNTALERTFGYVLTDAAGISSAPATMTVRVTYSAPPPTAPVAVADDVRLSSQTARYVPVGLNDTPGSFVRTGTGVRIDYTGMTGGCDFRPPTDQNRLHLGEIRVIARTTGNSTSWRVCNFTYSLVDLQTGLRSDVASARFEIYGRD